MDRFLFLALGIPSIIILWSAAALCAGLAIKIIFGRV